MIILENIIKHNLRDTKTTYFVFAFCVFFEVTAITLWQKLIIIFWSIFANKFPKITFLCLPLKKTEYQSMCVLDRHKCG